MRTNTLLIYSLDRILKPTANIWSVTIITLQDKEMFALTPCSYFALCKNSSTRYAHFLPSTRDVLPLRHSGSIQ